jgi:hypothetical protein
MFSIVFGGKKYGNTCVGSNFINFIELSMTISVADICFHSGSITMSIHNIHPGEYFQCDGSRDISQALTKDHITVIDNIDSVRIFVFILIYNIIV